MQKITQEDLQALIAKEAYTRFGETCTVCTLTLKSGYTVIGKSGCIDPDAFDENIGRKIAYDDAIGELWALEGYRMKSTMHQQGDKNG